MIGALRPALDLARTAARQASRSAGGPVVGESYVTARQPGWRRGRRDRAEVERARFEHSARPSHRREQTIGDLSVVSRLALSPRCRPAEGGALFEAHDGSDGSDVGEGEGAGGGASMVYGKPTCDCGATPKNRWRRTHKF